MGWNSKGVGAAKSEGLDGESKGAYDRAMITNRKRLLVLVAAYGVSLAIFVFGGSFRPFGCLALVTAMAITWRVDANRGEACADDWGQRFTVVAFVLAGLIAYHGIASAEGERTLRRELATICGSDIDMCDRLDEARASAAGARDLIGDGGDE